MQSKFHSDLPPRVNATCTDQYGNGFWGTKSADAILDTSFFFGKEIYWTRLVARST
jgi:hypothetical protein